MSLKNSLQSFFDKFFPKSNQNIDLLSPVPTPKPYDILEDPTKYEKLPNGHYRKIESPSPSPSGGDNNSSPYFDYAGSGISSDKINLQQPNPEITKLIFDMFGKDNYATPAAAIIAGENANFTPVPRPNLNRDLSIDYGLSQENNRAFADMLKRRPTQMEQYGIKSGDNVKTTLEDLVKNLAVMRMTLQEGGKNRFFGWMGGDVGNSGTVNPKIQGIPNYQPYLDYLNGAANLQQN